MKQWEVVRGLGASIVYLHKAEQSLPVILLMPAAVNIMPKLAKSSILLLTPKDVYQFKPFT